MKKSTTLTVGLPKDIRFDLKAKAVQQRTNVSAIIKKYLHDYISGKIKYQFQEFQDDMAIDDKIMIIIPEETRYKLKGKVADDRTKIRSVILYFIKHYLKEKDDKKAALSEIEQAYQEKQLKLFEA
ncbi:MAG: hypothetical protein AB8B61_00535 [Cyclobacteriaceae bacterium]